VIDWLDDKMKLLEGVLTVFRFLVNFGDISARESLLNWSFSEFVIYEYDLVINCAKARYLKG
jgi:hypothetical protein